MKAFATLSALLLVLLSAFPAEACHSCAGWGATWGKRLDVCASPSEGELEALIACDRIDCAVECASYLAAYDACAASGDPACIVVEESSPTDCDLCQAGVGAWLGIGCAPELQACSFDRTGCTPCDDWLENGGDSDNLCYPEGIDYAVALGGCACSGGCAAKCGGACGAGYFDPNSASFKCALCLAGGACSPQYATCAAN